jgi:hypothetical protein
LNNALRRKLALLWREILRTDPKDLFRDEFKKILPRHKYDKLPQPGFVGFEYEPGGLLFLGMNPGSAHATGGRGPRDEIFYQCLLDLLEVDDKYILEEFDKFNGYLLFCINKWKLFNNYIKPALRRFETRLSSIAFLNILHWRTQSDVNPRRLYEINWNKYTRKQIEALQPGVIIVLGKNAAKWFKEKWAKENVVPDVVVEYITRERNISKKERENEIKRIRRRLKRAGLI